MMMIGQGHNLQPAPNMKSEYPIPGILVAAVLLYLTPFTTTWLAGISFLICLYRVICYDARVFATDYCILLPLVTLTHMNGSPALLIYLCLLAGIWYFIMGGMKANAAFVILVILLNYLLARMQMDINAFVLCFGQMFVLCCLLGQQDEESAERAVKAFCSSLIVSSVYAFVLRNTSAIRGLTGEVAYAIWGTNILRFKGLLRDPNYYMTLLIIGLALLVKMKECGMMKTSWFVVQGLLMTVFGILTYSKTFFLVFVFLGGLYVLWQFWSRKIITGVVMTIVAVTALLILMFAEFSPFAVVMQRFLAADNISDFTTGRTDIYIAYWNEIIDTPWTFLFGHGLADEGIGADPHNIYLELMYYIGIIGFGLMVCFYAALVQGIRTRISGVREQHMIARNAVPVMFLVLFAALHGMFQVIVYGELFLAMLSFMIIKKKEEEVPEPAQSGAARYSHEGEGVIRDGEKNSSCAGLGKAEV